MILAAGAVATLAGALLVPHAGTAQQSVSDGAGYCPDARGVTVVVDFTDLGGDVVVRCAPGSGFTGLDALQRTGFAPAGTQRYGLTFICRLSGRPAADEPLAVKGNEDYTEACVSTPPQTAYWSYSYAANGGAWKYSSLPAKDHTVVAGGFEGWKFALNRSAQRSVPGVAPHRPGSAKGASPTPKPPRTVTPPRSTPPAPEVAPAPGPTTSAPPSPRASTTADKRRRRPKPTTTPHTSPSAPPTPTASASRTLVVTGDLPNAAEHSRAGDASTDEPGWFTAVGLGVVVVLGAVAALTARRRRRT